MQSRFALIALSIAVLLVTCASAQTTSAASTPTPPPVVILPGLGDLRHPTSTRNPEAQQSFDQGLRLIYTFNQDEAVRSFQHAAELDPKFAMASWGIAVAVGPNYNSPVDLEKIAVDAVRHALNISGAAPVIEQDYIRAISTPFSSAAKPDYRQLNIGFSRDMRDLSRESSGGMLLRNGVAAAAERVFRDGLTKNPRNPRSLFGLTEALKHQNRDYEAQWVQKQFKTSWQGADVTLTINEL